MNSTEKQTLKPKRNSTSYARSKNYSPRHFSRRAVLQALYAWHMTHASIEEIELNLILEKQGQKFNIDLFRQLFRLSVDNMDEINEVLTPCVDRTITEMDLVERYILVIAACELRFMPETPYKVVLNEAIEVAKVFGSDDESHKYINGALDKLVGFLDLK